MALWPSPICAGSSPHTRGALYRVGAIPKIGEDHPRIRGEHRWTKRDMDRLYRIIPAYAGSTSCARMNSSVFAGSSPHTRGAPVSRSTSTASRRDHPRIRGEHIYLDYDL